MCCMYCGSSWLTCYAWVDVVGSERWVRLIPSGEDSVWIVDANDLASLQGDLAVIVQGLDHAAVGL